MLGEAVEIFTVPFPIAIAPATSSPSTAIVPPLLLIVPELSATIPFTFLAFIVIFPVLVVAPVPFEYIPIDSSPELFVVSIFAAVTKSCADSLTIPTFSFPLTFKLTFVPKLALLALLYIKTFFLPSESNVEALVNLNSSSVAVPAYSRYIPTFSSPGICILSFEVETSAQPLKYVPIFLVPEILVLSPAASSILAFQYFHPSFINIPVF